MWSSTSAPNRFSRGWKKPPEEPLAIRSPTSREAQREASRARVLAAAGELFCRHGYEATTVRMIAARAGLSAAGVFNTFADKADILHHVRMLQNADVRAEVEAAALSLPGSAQERICNLVRLTYEREWRHLPLVVAHISASFTWSAATEAAMQAQYRNLFDAVRHVLDDGVATGELDPDLDTETARELIYAVYRGAYREAWREGWSASGAADRVQRRLRVLFTGFGARDDVKRRR